ncbi:hypothetical protein MINTMi198_27190 [Mycobacterium intracellulare M.i.198]|nr:hypothetical protein MINTMi198_27190 [Mycobacterium intracellulare M.i.198]
MLCRAGIVGFVVVVFVVEEFFGVVVGVGAGLAALEVGWGLNYPRFSSYSVARAGVGWLAWCEVPVRAASYSAGGT